jgi:hypothetical protein
LAASALAFTLFAGPFVPVLGPLSTLAFAAGYVWVSAVLWTGATGRVGTAQSGRRRVHLPGRTRQGRGAARGPAVPSDMRCGRRWPGTRSPRSWCSSTGSPPGLALVPVVTEPLSSRP